MHCWQRVSLLAVLVCPRTLHAPSTHPPCTIHASWVRLRVRDGASYTSIFRLVTLIKIQISPELSFPSSHNCVAAAALSRASEKKMLTEINMFAEEMWINEICPLVTTLPWHLCHTIHLINASCAPTGRRKSCCC